MFCLRRARGGRAQTHCRLHRRSRRTSASGRGEAAGRTLKFAARAAGPADSGDRQKRQGDFEPRNSFGPCNGIAREHFTREPA